MLFAALLISCEPESADPQGTVSVALTDAPIDDASVQGAFVTVAAIKVDGELYTGLEGKQTIDLLAYQNGETLAFGETEIAAGTYQELSLVLDLESDASGQAPGCYVLTESGEKINLAGSLSNTIELRARQSFDVETSATTELVVDVDLRKAIQRSSSDSYEFVSEAELDASVRAVQPASSGTVEGEVSANIGTELDQVVVYAYQKGTFNKEAETEARNGIAFRNAVSSSLAVHSGDTYLYTLAFLEAGEYDLCFANYADEDQDGKAEFTGFLNASVFLGGSVISTVSVEANTEIGLNLNILGIVD
ncbi:MAG: DUF4382 domain-containing protein [Bacteroidota bacterium]